MRYLYGFNTLQTPRMTNQMRNSTFVLAHIRHVFLLVALVFLQLTATGQPLGEGEVASRSLFDLFGQEEMPELSIIADFDSIKANIRNKEYVQGELVVEHNRNEKTALKVKLRPRGKSRRMMCDFPPLKLKFDKESLGANGLQTFNDFKLVTHCKEDNPAMEAVLLREYLVYQLLKVMTPYSFNTRLVEITYRNTGTSFKKKKQLGIIIEDAESLAYRNKCQVLTNKVIQLDSLHRNQEKITSVFQYMIGNADWSYLMGRNIELVEHESGQIVPIPYDFDYAGLVRAPYARANATLGQTTVLDRVYLGSAKSYEELFPIFSYFKEKREELYKVINDFNAIGAEDAAMMKNYLQGFFDLIEDKDKVETELLKLAK
jgi:hypothetical protein